MPKDWEIDLPGGRSKEDEDIVVDTTSTEPLRNAAADEPDEIEALEDKISRARRGIVTPPGSTGGREDPGPVPEQELTG
ncbi:MAG: hypothetical protein H0T21_05590 [Gemmatimonadaceae bacterium]|nr:hypothetical protein [Gemmatimonadaceae bacterium]